MSDSLTTSASKEEWDRFFQLDNQDSLLDSVSPVQSKSTDFESTSPSIPSLDFVSHSTGNSSPSELDNFAAQFSPVYHISPPPSDSSPTLVAPNPKKRKVAAADNAAPPQGVGRQPRGQKISHNVIEKRYRSNLNDKIAKLRDSVPELRSATPTVKRRTVKANISDSEGSGDDGDKSLKFNKATVLTKATEYIHQLEKHNQRLQNEVSKLRNRSGPVERLQNPPAISTSFSVGHITAPSAKIPAVTVTSSDRDETKTDAAKPTAGLIKVPDDVRRLRETAQESDHYGASITGPETVDQSLDPFNQPIKGLIPIPEDMRRLREQAAAQAHFAPESSFYNSRSFPDQEVFVEEEGEGSTWPRSKALSRVLIGSLAGLMVMEGLSEPDAGSKKNEKRGLFSLPTELVTESRGFRAQIRQRIINFHASPAASKILPLLLLSLIFFTLCFIVFVRVAPKQSKAVREGPEPVETKASQSANLARSTLAPTPQRPYSPPPNRPLEPANKSWDFGLIDRLSMEWFGTSWFSRRLDEEAFRRSSGRFWTSFRVSLPKLHYEKRPS